MPPTSSRLIHTFDVFLQDDIYPQVWQNTGLCEEKIRALALSAWYANNWQAPHDTLDMISATTGEPSRREAIRVLSGSWGVTSHDEAVSTIQSLVRGMHAPDYELVHPLVLEAVEAEGPRPLPLPRDNPNPARKRHHDLLEAAARHRDVSESYYVMAYESWLQAIKLGACSHMSGPLPAQIRAWDQARAVFVVRASVTAGYLAVEEGWELALATLEQARLYHRNWAQFGRSFVTGYTFWCARGDLAEASAASVIRQEDIQMLFLAPLSPWRALELHAGAPSLPWTPAHDPAPQAYVVAG
ncbi:hypothetical protein KEM60_02729 [Austwickia sp. TVS 96-490-7B]|uniref:DUF1266 domain-containing protein n=1 Tax=Austwickia sp. TVS 96-490-7B TaxID=2830843 RepID=UPI001C597A08|nr:DUF1266 domain-containing protein [Austwickia sp. TVS 96-490-7B]MBW3086508.1 hypothetical protein [Austwickia sp. TVS 96-490-7B]